MSLIAGQANRVVVVTQLSSQRCDLWEDDQLPENKSRHDLLTVFLNAAYCMMARKISCVALKYKQFGWANICKMFHVLISKLYTCFL